MFGKIGKTLSISRIYALGLAIFLLQVGFSANAESEKTAPTFRPDPSQTPMMNKPNVAGAVIVAPDTPAGAGKGKGTKGTNNSLPGDFKRVVPAPVAIPKYGAREFYYSGTIVVSPAKLDGKPPMIFNMVVKRWIDVDNKVFVFDTKVSDFSGHSQQARVKFKQGKNPTEFVSEEADPVSLQLNYGFRLQEGIRGMVFKWPVPGFGTFFGREAADGDTISGSGFVAKSIDQAPSYSIRYVLKAGAANDFNSFGADQQAKSFASGQVWTPGNLRWGMMIAKTYHDKACYYQIIGSGNEGLAASIVTFLDNPAQVVYQHLKLGEEIESTFFVESGQRGKFTAVANDHVSSGDLIVSEDIQKNTAKWKVSLKGKMGETVETLNIDNDTCFGTYVQGSGKPKAFRGIQTQIFEGSALLALLQADKSLQSVTMAQKTHPTGVRSTYCSGESVSMNYPNAKPETIGIHIALAPNESKIYLHRLNRDRVTLEIFERVENTNTFRNIVNSPAQSYTTITFTSPQFSWSQKDLSFSYVGSPGRSRAVASGKVQFSENLCTMAEVWSSPDDTRMIRRGNTTEAGFKAADTAILIEILKNQPMKQ